VTSIICGVDISSAMLDARIGRQGPAGRFARSVEGITALAAFCHQHAVTLVAMEATGGYERLPFALLWQHNLPAVLLNPRCVRQFAEAMGFLEKTDAIDAGVIAWYAEVKAVSATQPPSQAQDRLAALVTRLGQLTQARTVQTNQRRLVGEPLVLDSIDELVKLINRQIRSLETEIARLIDTDPLWKQLSTTFRTIKGVADRTVARLMAHLPEIGQLDSKAVAKLAGLAPLARDSGQSTGGRRVRGGRNEIREILFVVAEIVRRHEKDFAEFYQKLLKAGKAKKVIRIALARMLLVRLNAKAREVRNAIANAAILSPAK
jgi:transposase